MWSIRGSGMTVGRGGGDERGWMLRANGRRYCSVPPMGECLLPLSWTPWM